MLFFASLNLFLALVLLLFLQQVEHCSSLSLSPSKSSSPLLSSVASTTTNNIMPTTSTPKVNPFDSAVSLAADIKDGEITSRELLEVYIDRIEKYDNKINAIVQRDFDTARQRADKADAIVDEWRENGMQKDQLGVFHGVPMTIKEGTATPGFGMTGGDPYIRLPSWFQSTIIKPILDPIDSGAILIGKSNLPINQCDWECNNPRYGRTVNPYDPTRTPGGSSGGASAALAAGLIPLEVGSDIGGSIRIPAMFCGIVGHCPTRGLLPSLSKIEMGCCGCFDNLVHKLSEPLVWMGRGGPMARYTEDVVTMLEVMAGEKTEALRQPKQNSKIKDYRVGIWRTQDKFPIGRQVTNAINKAVTALKKSGATVVEIEPPVDPMESYTVYLQYLSCFTKLHMPKQQKQNAKNGHPQDSYPSDIQSPFDQMDMASVNGVPNGTDKKLQSIESAWDDYLKQNFDVVFCPIFPCEAYPNANSPNDMLSDAKLCARKLELDVNMTTTEMYYGDGLFWQHLQTLLGLPATGFPVKFTDKDATGSSLPVGLQAFAAKGGDFIVLDTVDKLMKELGASTFRPPPNFV